MEELTLTPAEGLCRELVRIPSVSGDEARAAAFVASVLADAGLDVERIGPAETTVFARAGNGGGPRLFFNSHLDTVPAGEGWLADPWDVDWTTAGDGGGRLTGLGANDATASVASMVAAITEFARSPSVAGEVWLGLTACEETSNAGMTELLEHFDRNQLGRPDAAVTGEPTGLEVVRAQSGLCVLEARWTGRSCHAAHVARVEHENALRIALRDLANVPDYTLLDGEHELLGQSTLVCTVLQSGQRHNKVPDEALAVFDARLAPPHTAAECAAYLAARMPRADVTIRSERLRPVETPAEHALVRAALAAGGRVRPIGSSTMSDMALLADIPAIKCGPGETARSHTPNEYVTRAELEAGVRFYSRLIDAVLDGPTKENT